MSEPDAYRVAISLQLPLDRRSPPFVRHLTSQVLGQLGVIEEAIRDIELALTEACANVLEHAGSGDDYHVNMTIRMDRCELVIMDAGTGLDRALVRAADMSPVDGERGRGLALIKKLMDQVHLVSAPNRGTTVILVKGLAFDEESPARGLLDPAACEPVGCEPVGCEGASLGSAPSPPGWSGTSTGQPSW
jgi:serine/threonine-protein kinase RsbW